MSKANERDNKNQTNLDRGQRKQKLFNILGSKDYSGLTNIGLGTILPRNSKKIQVLDFFSGCGGMSYGFSRMSDFLPSVCPIWALDINKDALESYKANHWWDTVIRDIRTVGEDPQSVRDFLEKTFPKYDKNAGLILIGCAPCQGFSAHRKKNWDKEDLRNNLVIKFAEISAIIQPECIIMENVPELLSWKYIHYFEEAKKIWESAGYTVKYRIYNTASFWVPQERKRALIIAMKSGFELPEESLSSNDFRTVRDAIGDLPPVLPGIPHAQDSLHRCAKHRKETIDVMKQTPVDWGSRPKWVGPKCLDKIKWFSDVYGRLAWDKPSITITHYSRNPASGRFVHPSQDRWLTIRESARLQSFPDDFKFIWSIDSIYKQIGEAVPPLFSCAVATSVMIDLLDETY